jgi:hypothetical protein
MMLTLFEWHPEEASGRTSVSTVSSSNASLLFHLTLSQFWATCSVKDHSLWSALSCWWTRYLLARRRVPSVPTVLQSIWLALHHFWSSWCFNASESSPYSQAVCAQVQLWNFSAIQHIACRFCRLIQCFQAGHSELISVGKGQKCPKFILKTTM